MKKEKKEKKKSERKTKKIIFSIALIIIRDNSSIIVQKTRLDAVFVHFLPALFTATVRTLMQWLTRAAARSDPNPSHE